MIVAGDLDYVYFLDIKITEELKNVYYVREISNRIQKSRKEAKVAIDDQIVIQLSFKEDGKLKKAFEKEKKLLANLIKKPVTSEEIISHTVYTSPEFEIEKEIV